MTYRKIFASKVELVDSVKEVLPTLSSVHFESDPSRKETEIALTSQILELNTTGAVNKDKLNAIIALCNTYIESIPNKERAYYLYHKNSDLPEGKVSKEVLEFDLKYPLAAKVAEIQQLAVRFTMLPDAESVAKARWKQVQTILVDKTHSGNLMNEKHHMEAAFKGQLGVYKWAYGLNQNALLSYHEILVEMKQQKGFSAENIFYASDLDKAKFLVTFKTHNDEVSLVNHQDNPINSTAHILNPNNNELETVRVAGVVSNMTLYSFTNNHLYVLDKIVASQSPDQLMHHSSMGAGKRADCAGTMEVENGKIKVITNDSGHYAPEAKQLIGLIKLLEANNVDLKDTTIKIVTGRNARTGTTQFKPLTLEEFKKEYSQEFTKDVNASPGPEIPRKTR